jgi:TRAP-type C4-dicarboxylate transport system permease small subunit
LEKISGLVLVVIMLLTGCDIVGRILKIPIPGAFELVAFAGGLIVGLSVPMSIKMEEQVRIEAVMERLPRYMQLSLKTITRSAAVLFLLLISYALVQMGNDLRMSGELSAVLNLPFYYVAYVMSFAFIVAAVVLARQLMAIWRPANE